MGLRRGEMGLLKRVMRDITNPQYWAKLSLNLLMIAIFSLVHCTGLYKPLWRGGGWGDDRVGGQGLSWRPRAGTLTRPPTFRPFSEAAGSMLGCLRRLPSSSPAPGAGRGTGRRALLLWHPQQMSLGWAHESLPQPLYCPAVPASGLFGCAEGRGWEAGGGRREGSRPGSWPVSWKARGLRA